MNKERFRTVSEISKQAGISVRTLHYYDEIGLLQASMVNESGYRLYDDTALVRLQQILFLKEMGFELKRIKMIVEDEQYDMRKALEKQREILTLKKVHMENLITLIDKQLKEGSEVVELEVFNTMAIEKLQDAYKEEVENRWGQTNAYKECKEKTKEYNQDKWKDVTAQGEAILKQFAAYKDEKPSDEKVQELVEAWRNHISTHFYECTLEILEGLGAMYIADERFMKNMDQHGEGTTKLLSEAIAYYCDKHR